MFLVSDQRTQLFLARSSPDPAVKWRRGSQALDLASAKLYSEIGIWKRTWLRVLFYGAELALLSRAKVSRWQPEDRKAWQLVGDMKKSINQIPVLEKYYIRKHSEVPFLGYRKDGNQTRGGFRFLQSRPGRRHPKSYGPEGF